MPAAHSKAHVSRYINEDENFWKKHLSSYSSSGLKRPAYCRKNAVNYHRFVYWEKKLSLTQQNIPLKSKEQAQKIHQLLPVRLKPEIKESTIAASCTLTLKNGCILQIHDQQSLAFILEKVV